MSAAELIGHLYKRRDQRPRGSVGWHDLDRAVLLLNRALLCPPETPQDGELVGVVRLWVWRDGERVIWATDGEQFDGEAGTVSRALREAGMEAISTQGADVPRSSQCR